MGRKKREDDSTKKFKDGLKDVPTLKKREGEDNLQSASNLDIADDRSGDRLAEPAVFYSKNRQAHQHASTPREAWKRKFHVSVLRVRAPGGAIERAKMRGADTYEQYATECERIARTMSGEQRKSLMAIAEAWRELAREAERRPSSSREK
jgi:hypothetical protein